MEFVDHVLVVLFVHLMPILLCTGDEVEYQTSSTDVYYDYVTEDSQANITNQKISIDRLSDNHNGSSEFHTTNNPNYEYRGREHENKRNLPRLAANETTRNVSRSGITDISSNYTIEFDHKHLNANTMNTEYEVSDETSSKNSQTQTVKDPFFYTTLPVYSETSKRDEIPTVTTTFSPPFENTNIKSELSEDHHPCNRECIDGEEPMTCRYSFSVEWYYAMSKACFNCSADTADCYRPDCIAVNGVKRPIIVVNRTLPGPSIEVCLSDRIIVDIHNHLIDESTSVHWHGHHQRGSPYMDGVPFITQCPIPPRTTFRYSYLAATAGTHFWHSHSGCQRTDGVVGNLIIRVPRSRDPHAHLYDMDLGEHIINVMDWAHELGASMFAAHYHSDGDNKPESILVNGRGRYFKDSINKTATPLSVFTVQQGLRYRFRLINAGNQNCPIELYIENHTLTVINSDGGDFKPVEAGSLVTYAGERWDFILKANAPVGNYWMRFKGLMDCDERFTMAHQVAILRYEGAGDKEPESYVDYFGPEKPGLKVNAMNERLADPGTISIPELTAINVDNDPSLKPNADHQFYISYDFYPVDAPHYHKPHLYGFYDVKNKRERVYTPQFNHISMQMPSMPLLSQRDSITKDMFCDHRVLKNCTETPCHCTNVIKIPLGDVVELILIDEGHTYNANHPFHLHGHQFRVVGMDRLGESTTPQYVRDLDKAGRLWRNLKTAPLKDSVTVPDGGYTIIRFHAINPGYWLFHCHLEFHVEVGMALIFKIGEHSDIPPVPKDFPTCGDYLHSQFDVSQLPLGNKKENEINFGEEYTKNNRTQSFNSKLYSWFSTSEASYVHNTVKQFSMILPLTLIIFSILV